ncbi:unnamed protein product, partial [Rotaria magnacalcarata]
VPDFHEDQMWIDDNMKESDPWMNLTIEPVFQYPVMENQELFVNMTRDPVEHEIAAAFVLLKVSMSLLKHNFNISYLPMINIVTIISEILYRYWNK